MKLLMIFTTIFIFTISCSDRGKYIAQSENLGKEYESNPQNMLEEAQKLEESNQLFKARNELQNLIQIFPDSKEVSIAQERIEKINLHIESIKEKKEIDKYLNSLIEFFTERFSHYGGRTELKSVTLSASELVLTVSSPRCVDYASIFIDVGIFFNRRKNGDKMIWKFDRIILNLQCEGKATKYFVARKDLLRYLSETVKDCDFIATIKIEEF